MNSGNYKMLSVHTTNDRLVKISDHRLRNSNKSEMPTLKKRYIMCATGREIYTYTQLNKNLERKSVADPMV
jgi:hypothetical protein